MQAPAIFLIAVTLLFASMWSSDSNYTDKDAVKLAKEAAMREANVAYRTNISIQSKTLRLAQVNKQTSFEEVKNDPFIVTSQKRIMSNEISIPVLFLYQKKFTFSNSIYFPKKSPLDSMSKQVELANEHYSSSTYK